MKAKSIVIAISMMLTTSAWADAPNADAAAPASTSAPMDMTAPAEASAPVAAELPAADAAPAQFQKIDENLDRMHALVRQMKDAKDPAERHKLMTEYMTAQHENMMLVRDAMGMGGPGMGMMGKKDCDVDGMRGRGGMDMMGKKNCDIDDMRGMGMMGGTRGMGKNCDMDKMGKRDCDCDDMRGMGGMGGMGMRRGMGMMGGGMGPGMRGMRDEATTARIESLEKRLDVLQEMMKMMMQR
jgi:hypothetical protein